MNAVGVVAVGRNEGERLAGCLESLRRDSRNVSTVVYADSGSSDGSTARARSLGAEVVELDPSRPFSAARGRNEGFARLREIMPDVEFVQFIDGDCEMSTAWLDKGLAALRADEKLAIVCGRVRERHRDASIYNRLCDMEFNRRPGIVDACGGIFLARRAAIERVGGFDAGVVAGEEPEMCLRLRREGYTILRLADDMCLHDSAMMHLLSVVAPERPQRVCLRARRLDARGLRGASRRQGDPEHLGLGPGAAPPGRAPCVARIRPERGGPDRLPSPGRAYRAIQTGAGGDPGGPSPLRRRLHGSRNGLSLSGRCGSFLSGGAGRAAAVIEHRVPVPQGVPPSPRA